MRPKLAVLGGALAMATTLIAPASAHAATYPVLGCGYMVDVGNNFSAPIGDAYDEGGFLHFYNSDGADEMCAVSLGSGYYQITDKDKGCVGYNSVTTDITVEIPKACAINGGLGYLWDQWSTVSYDDGGHTVWQFVNANNGNCMYDDLQQPAIETTCAPNDKFEWFYWPDSGL